uniref:Ribulose bisphosphate carboxylase small subunit, chloroplastic 2 n=1 Tax=Lemna gibba TaxID=4470 RepID=RBS2_LEMGI|nr:RecName: Full=Ribulose bisphosphate carboxylase small subunit, chloroplastic 2; Short=RuBisCO small subunit 2; Short=RuBisCO small subunit SSU26; Flags: Precursor [Lemna gibba]CAA35101.1 ribulose bisphosphate carboxylase [Lemna gibba]
MASSMMASTAAVARAGPAQSNMVAPFNGLRSSVAFPATRKANKNLSTLPSNGGKVSCMQVWPPEGLKKFETLSYLPPLSVEDLAKEVDYLLRNDWVPCIEFSKEGFVYRENHASPGYYDGRYWTMWKLPMFGCTDASQVIAEVEEAKKAYPEYFVRIIGFDNKRQVQCISFIAYKPT